MGFGKAGKPYKTKSAKKQRGSMDAQLTEAAILDSWEGLQDHLDEEEDSMNEEMKVHFNAKWPGSGDVLIGEAGDFQSFLANMSSAEEKMALFKELFNQNVIDQASLQEE